MSIRIIPVLDLKGGVAVDAVAGDRDNYLPLSGAAEGPDPIAWAHRLRSHLIDVPGPVALYVADLDAIEGHPPRLDLFGRLARSGFAPWVDAGLRRASEVVALLESGVDVIVAGSETVEGPETLPKVLERTGPDRLAFSLDLRDGRPILGDPAAWGTADPLRIATTAIALGLRRLLLIDLARVGTGEGIGTEGLAASIRSAAPPDLELIVGGGISGSADLDRLAAIGADAVLVGAALRDGRIGGNHGRDPTGAPRDPRRDPTA